MPRPKKPARLWQRRDGAWIILDAGAQHRTGHSGEGGRRAAEEALRDYLATRAPERTGPAHPFEITVGEVLALYARENGPQTGRARHAGVGDEGAGAVLGRAYLRCGERLNLPCLSLERAKPRPTSGDGCGAPGPVVRRELGVLQAAINYALAEGKLVNAPVVTLSERGPTRDRWLTRDEAARLMRASAPHFAALHRDRASRRAAGERRARATPRPEPRYRLDRLGGRDHPFRGRPRAQDEEAPRVGLASAELAAHMRRWARLAARTSSCGGGSPAPKSTPPLTRPRAVPGSMT